MRYYIARVNHRQHTREYRMLKTLSRWTPERDKAYPFATYEVAKAVADRESRLLHPSLRSAIRYVIEEAPPER